MSSINPNNINGNYPVAGQDNDSQGFRDNFTNIKNNLTTAYNELTDLQNSVILKAPLGSVGQTSITNDLNYSQLAAAKIIREVATTNNVGVVTGSISVDWTLGHYQYLTTSGNVTLSFGSWPTSGVYTKLRLQANVTSTGHWLTLGSGVVYQNLSNVQGVSGSNIIFASTGLYMFEFSTLDNGNNVFVRDLTRNYNIETSGVTGTFVTLNATGVVSAGQVVAPFIGNASTSLIGTLANSTQNNITTVGALSAPSMASPLIGNVGAVHYGTTANIIGTATIGTIASPLIGNVGAVHYGTTANIIGTVTASLSIAGQMQAATFGNTGATFSGATATIGNVQAVTVGNTATTYLGASFRSSGNIGFVGVSSPAITQGTSRVTAVTNNAVYGNILLFTGTIGAYSSQQFQLFNSIIQTGDYVMIQQGNVGNTYIYTVSAFANTAGAAVVTLKNNGPVASPSEPVSLNYVVIKAQ